MAIGIVSAIGAAVTCLDKLSSAMEHHDFKKCMQEEAGKLREAARQSPAADEIRKLEELAARFHRAAEGDLTAWQPSALGAYQANSA